MTEMVKIEALAKLCEVEVLLQHAIKDVAIATYLASRTGDVEPHNLAFWTESLNKRLSKARTAMDWALLAIHRDNAVKSSEESEAC